MIKLIIEYLKNKDSIWNVFSNYLFDPVVGIKFPQKFDFSVDKIPIKMVWLLANKHTYRIS